MADPRLIPLMDLLADFNRDELDEVATRLGVELEDLAGSARPAQARELVKYLERRKRLDDLVRTGRKLRPELDWPDDALPTPAPDTTAPPEPRKPSSTSTVTAGASSAESKAAIYISYAFGQPWEEIVDDLERNFQARGIEIIRDRRNLGYKGSIKAFMESIGRGRYVIVVISEKYLKSENCMFELLEIAGHGDLQQRIFPIVLEGADIYKAIERIRYIKYWEQRIAELDSAMKEVGSANLHGIREDIDLYTRIRNQIAGLTDILRNMLVLTPEMHRGSDFETLYQAIEAAMKQDRQ
ncbi:MAG: TIR domain-containing protein [Candidatus Accumulibacter meliphilus]|jgi:hypothetical protein|uniref:TIR domain-containing protein n=1 Tax=Candidatus Accumulibacter meliphilus TaxID=2211374 RepID=UPI002FC2E49D